MKKILPFVLLLFFVPLGLFLSFSAFQVINSNPFASILLILFGFICLFFITPIILFYLLWKKLKEK